jgi:DnaJ-domain-containing protein 1
MFELAGGVIVGLLTLQGIKFLLVRGIFLGSRRKEPKRDAKRRPVHERWARTEQEPQQQQPEQEREGERWRWRQRKWALKESKENQWWSVLEVSQYASVNEIRRSYLRKIKQSHPDRMVSLAPELLPLAEGRAKALNVAYAAAIRARRGK